MTTWFVRRQNKWRALELPQHVIEDSTKVIELFVALTRNSLFLMQIDNRWGENITHLVINARRAVATLNSPPTLRTLQIHPKCLLMCCSVINVLVTQLQLYFRRRREVRVYFTNCHTRSVISSRHGRMNFFVHIHSLHTIISYSVINMLVKILVGMHATWRSHCGYTFPVKVLNRRQQRRQLVFQERPFAPDLRM